MLFPNRREISLQYACMKAKPVAFTIRPPPLNLFAIHETFEIHDSVTPEAETDDAVFKSGMSVTYRRLFRREHEEVEKMITKQCTK